MLNTLFAGQLNTPVVASWLLIYLATNKQWMSRVRNEVDLALNTHRIPEEPPQKTLRRLRITSWESEFPMIEMCMRECLRLQVAGAAYRYNCTGEDYLVRGTGEVIPKSAFAVSDRQSAAIC